MATKTNGSSLTAADRERVFNLVANAYLSRARSMRSLLTDPRRNYYHECGYPESSSMTAEMYRELYDRFGVARRVVELWPDECWRRTPWVYEDEDSDRITPFEQAWDDVADSLKGQSWYKTEEGNPVWDYLRRADIRSRIGRFGLILIGLDDGLDLREPAVGIDERGQRTKAPGRRLLYLRVFDESAVQINRFETDRSNPRYGFPVEYQVKLNDPSGNVSGIGLNTNIETVHWSRVIHLACGLGSSEVWAPPAMEPCLNHLLDLGKLYGGSAEMYWKGAFPGLSLETHPQLGPEVEVNVAELRDKLEKYFNGLDRFFHTTGMTSKMLSPTVADPSPQIEVHLQGICITLAVPQRIFMGSERGELASSQDQGAWNNRVAGHQALYETPRVIVPFVDRLICLGVLPEPSEDGYRVAWPEPSALSDQEKAQLAVTRTDALAKFQGGGLESLVSPMDYLVRFLGMEEEEAKTILEATEQRIEEEDTGGSPLLSLVGGLTGITELFKAAKDGAMSEEQLKQTLMMFFKLSADKAKALLADGIPSPPPTPAETPPQFQQQQGGEGGNRGEEMQQPTDAREIGGGA